MTPSEASEKLLKPDRENFARHYAKFGKTAGASRAAGIHPNTGAKWLQDEDVKARIEYLQELDWEEEAEARRDVGPAFVLAQYKDIVDSKEVDVKDRLRALHDLAIICGLIGGKEETVSRDAAAKVYIFGKDADPSKIGLVSETVPEKTEVVLQNENCGEEEERVREIIPISHGATKKIVLPGGVK